MKQIWPWLCALASGVLLALCYAPASLGGLAWLALTPLIAAGFVYVLLVQLVEWGTRFLRGQLQGV